MHEKSKFPSLKSPTVLFLSFGGVGFAPKAPGTWGTLAVMPLLFLLGYLNIPTFFLIPIIVILTAISCYMAELFQRQHHIHDPSWIVIDEVLGICVAWLFVGSHNPINLAAIFLLFRFFDIVKWGPVAYFDRLEHGAGTILDDIAAGLLAGMTYLAFKHIASFFFS